MITIEQAKIIARHPEYYHSENLHCSVLLLERKNVSVEKIEAELLERAKLDFKRILAEYPDMVEMMNCVE